MVLEAHIYDAYGNRAGAIAHARAAYIGEAPEAATGHYLLGERLYDPTLRRFHNADSLSPFDEGGVNRYAYCSGDPINRTDLSGNAWRGWPFIPRSRLKAGGGAADNTIVSPAAPDAAVIASASVLDAKIVAGSVASGAAIVDQVSEAIFGTLSSGPIDIRYAGSVPRRDQNGAFSGKQRAGSTDNMRYLGKSQSRHKAPASKPITVISDPQGREVYAHRNGRRYIEPKWHERHMSLAHGGTVSHWLADAPIVTTHVLEPLQRISEATSQGPETNIYVYTGVHGVDNGQNWVNGKRAYSAPLSPPDIQTFDIFRNQVPNNLALHSEDIFGISTRSMKGRMQRPGFHIHAYCFSAVDSLVTDTLNVDPIPIYRIP